MPVCKDCLQKIIFVFMNSKEIRERLKLARIKKGYSQETFAGKIGMSANSYCDIENGKTRLFHPKLHIIANELDIPLQSLFIGSPNAEEYQKEIAQIKEKYSKELEELKIEYNIAFAKVQGKNKELETRVETLNNIIGVLQEKRQIY